MILKNNLSTQKNGQALIELIFVVGLFSTILVALISLTIVSLSTVQKSRLRTRATTIAQQGLENIRANRDRLSWVDFTTDCPGEVEVWAEMDTVSGLFIPTATCAINSGRADIIISVNWAFGNKSDYNVSISSALYEADTAIYR